MRDKTIICHYGEDPAQYQGAIVPPIFQNSLYAFEDWDGIDRAFDSPQNNCIYSRGKNFGVAIVEEKLAKLAGGEKAKLFASGMGAISAAIMHFVKHGDHIITIKNVYGPANNFMGGYLKEKLNIETTFVVGKEIQEFAAAIRPNTTLIYLESPSSAVFSLQDIEAVAKLARLHGIKTIIDNTWATFIYQKPLAMGIDLEVHSCSKYLGGHSDIVAGLVIGKTADLDAIFVKEAAWFGAKMAPFEAWLLLRSLRTLPLRLEQHQKSTREIASFLADHPKIRKVYYPGLPDFDQADLARRQMTGVTGLFSFELQCGELEKIKKFVNSLELFSIGVSWGGHESLVYAPAISYLKELPPEKFAAMGICLGTIRVSIGLEDPADLLADLENALEFV
jgi:cystathionine beta-lyase/cystathionine gamma-synthase